ncbi:malonyl CoA-ACP transacylase [Mycolicibacterium litorale]|nr:malonyl CoA-ACP transacylase [Mycolicibacterium litorale]
MSVAATVGGEPVEVREVDAREAALRAAPQVAALPRPGTSEGRQLRRWLTQLVVTERVVAHEAALRGIVAHDAPGEDDVLPDATARLEIGSVAAAALAVPLARALFAHLTADIDVDEAAVVAYHARYPRRFSRPGTPEAAGGWRVDAAADLAEVRPQIAAHLRGAARRRAFRMWLSERRAALVWLAPGYEHPGDPRQPDNTHKH